MKSEHWRAVRERIGAASERRAANVLGVSIEAGAIVADAIERGAAHADEFSHSGRLRLRFEITLDLLTGATSAVSAQPESAPPSPPLTAPAPSEESPAT